MIPLDNSEGVQLTADEAILLADRLKRAKKAAADLAIEVTSLRTDNARKQRALDAYRRSDKFELGSKVAATIFALLGGGWPIALAGYLERYGWDGLSAIYALMTLLWSVALSAIVLKCLEK